MIESLKQTVAESDLVLGLEIQSKSCEAGF